MTYDIYRYIFIGAAIMCGIMLLVTLLLFIILKIPSVIGDLSGRTAKKAIHDIRQQNMSANTDKIQESKLTDKITASGRLVKRSGRRDGTYTEKINTEKLMEENKLSNNETSVLSTARETEVLSSNNETTILNGNETTVLTPDMNGNVTSELAGVTEPLREENTSGYVNVELDITFIHTDEIIR